MYHYNSFLPEVNTVLDANPQSLPQFLLNIRTLCEFHTWHSLNSIVQKQFEQGDFYMYNRVNLTSSRYKQLNILADVYCIFAYMFIFEL